MKRFEEILENAFYDADLRAADIPNLDLYMDQILTLVDEGLAQNKRRPEDKLLTKTMVNNYSKERLIAPVKGKKYTREQVMQLLCILNLKQTLSLADIKTLMTGADMQACFEQAHESSLILKERLRLRLKAVLQEELGEIDDMDVHTQILTLALALSSASNLLRRTCEGLADDLNGTGG